MQQITIPGSSASTSRLMLGCMTLGAPKNNLSKAKEAIRAALEAGINAFDHADIYRGGRSESLFGEFLKQEPGIRESIFIQSKCGIRFANDPVEGAPKRYDFSKEHILASVEGSLKRLRTEYLDCLLLHRPDVLMDPEEVASAFDQLEQSGKVRFFGVSNQSPSQMDLLRRWVRQLIVANQIQISLTFPIQFESRVVPKGGVKTAGMRSEGALDYCHLHTIIPQAWSPLSKGKLSGKPLEAAEAHLQPLVQAVEDLSHKHAVSREAIILSWLCRHPAGIQPVVGTANPDRIRNCAEAFTGKLRLSREEWYTLLNLGMETPIP